MDPRPSPSAAPLSFTERAILDALRDGRCDAEIAVQLGLTNAGLKARIDALVRTAGVPSRAALVSWDAEAPPASSPDPSESLEPPAPALRKPVPRLRLGATLAAVIVLALAGYRLAPSGAGDRLVPPTETRPDPSSPPLPPAGRVDDLLALPPVPFPNGLLLFTLRTCTGCAGSTALDRTLRDRGGAFHHEAVYVSHTAEGSILGAWSAPGASNLVLTECDAPTDGGSCAHSRVLQSLDAGATWTEQGAVPGAAYPIGVTGLGRPLVRVLLSGSAEPAILAVAGGRATDGSLHAPPGARDEEALRASLDPALARALVAVRASPGGATAFTWYPESPYPDAGEIVTALGIADPARPVEKTFLFHGTPLAVGPWLDPATLVAWLRVDPAGEVTGESTYTPALLDVDRGTIAALAVPSGAAPPEGMTRDIIAAAEGAFERLLSSGGCVPLLSSPGSTGPASQCAAAGSVVEVLETQRLPGGEWRRIRTFSGLTGWLNTAPPATAFAQP